MVIHQHIFSHGPLNQLDKVDTLSLIRKNSALSGREPLAIPLIKVNRSSVLLGALTGSLLARHSW